MRDEIEFRKVLIICESFDLLIEILMNFMKIRPLL